MEVKGIFIIKSGADNLIKKIDELFSKYNNRSAVNDKQNLALYRSYCHDIISMLNTSFEPGMWGIERCKKFIEKCRWADDVNIINTTLHMINGMLLDLKYMVQNSIPIKDFPSCKKLTELSCEDAISLSKDLVKNGIIKSGIGIIMLGKAVTDGIEIVHIRQFYENMLNELQREMTEEQHTLIPIEQLLIEKCNAEIGYCDIAMIKTGLKAGKEIKGLMDAAHKNIEKFEKEASRYNTKEISFSNNKP